MQMTRREWLKLSSATSGVLALSGALGNCLPTAHAVERAPSDARPWEIGCFNRPWMRWTYDEALDALKACGFRLTGLVGGHKGEAFILPEATPDYLDRLQERIESRGLKAIVSWFEYKRAHSYDEAVKFSRTQIDNAQRLGLKTLMSGATGGPENYEQYYRVMADSAAYGQDRGIRIVVKPHGGCAATADDVLTCLEKVKHPNFRIWYDAGNIIHYTGHDPVAAAERLARYSTGFCAKDCAKEKGDVMIQFGEGKADFPAVFAKLKQGGFQGPLMIECCGGKSQEEVTAAARANKEFLEKALRNV